MFVRLEGVHSKRLEGAVKTTDTIIKFTLII
jgi:hypothetical protein